MRDTTISNSAGEGRRPEKIAVIGDLILDTYAQGDVTRISPEAPVPVLLCREEMDVPGGAANVAANIEALGGHAALTGLIGRDSAGDRLVAALGRLAWETPPDVLCDQDWVTPHKTRYRAGAQHLLRVDREDAAARPGLATGSGIREAVRMAARDARLAVISDYGKGTLPAALRREVMCCFRSLRLPVLVDTKASDLSDFAGAELITPNVSELAAATGRAIGAADDVAGAARSLLLAHGIKAAVVTMGASGMLVVEHAHAQYLPTVARQLFDVSGAGDTVIAALAVALSEGASLLEAARFANAAAGIAVEKPGTAVVHRHEVRQRRERPAQGPIFDATADRQTLNACVAAWRAQRLKVGFTNGCFDILHDGHLKLIAEAASRCDRLVVGVNSDASVRRLKGSARPVQSEAIRSTVLSGIAGVAAVVIFAEDTPLALIEEIRPDVLVKGADYPLDRIVGAKETLARGGDVLRVPLLEGHSSSNLIRRLEESDDATGKAAL